MNQDDIDTVLLAKNNYKFFLGSTIITSLLIVGGIALLPFAVQEPSYRVCLSIALAIVFFHNLGVAGFLPRKPIGQKRAPIPYGKLLSILERQLVKDVSSIEYLGTVRNKQSPTGSG